MSNDDREHKIKLVELIRDIIQHDHTLREKYQIGERFRFVKDRLGALLEQLEKHITSTEPSEKKAAGGGLAEDETMAYVYLYNAQGILVQTWLKMLTPKLFYEYSVNRPIYAERLGIETLIRFKANKVQHGFLTVIIKKSDILQAEGKDTAGNVMLKVREGAFKFNRLVSFSHNEIDYSLTEEGALVKKDSGAF
jgi:hypothetical protein